MDLNNDSKKSPRFNKFQVSGFKKCVAKNDSNSEITNKKGNNNDETSNKTDTIKDKCPKKRISVKFITKKRYFKTENVQANYKKRNEQLQYKEGRWSKEEKIQFLKGIALYGKNWKKIKKLIETRSSPQVRSHGQKFFIKMKKIKNKELGIDFTLDSITNINDMVQQIKQANKDADIVKIFMSLISKNEEIKEKTIEIKNREEKTNMLKDNLNNSNSVPNNNDLENVDKLSKSDNDNIYMNLNSVYNAMMQMNALKNNNDYLMNKLINYNLENKLKTNIQNNYLNDNLNNYLNNDYYQKLNNIFQNELNLFRLLTNLKNNIDKKNNLINNNFGVNNLFNFDNELNLISDSYLNILNDECPQLDFNNEHKDKINLDNNISSVNKEKINSDNKLQK